MEEKIEEALRYLGAGKDGSEELRREVAAVAETITEKPRFVYRVFTLERMGRADGKARFRLEGTGLILEGETASVMLSQCKKAALLLCTLGARFDMALRSMQARDMAKAVILNACGSAWVEAGCDEAELAIAAHFPGYYLTDRFSPGYGDLPLSLQRGICDLLDGGRRLGISVTDSFLMNPAKSVSAIIGIADCPQMARVRGCGHCSFRDNCPVRKGGRKCQAP